MALPRFRLIKNKKIKYPRLKKNLFRKNKLKTSDGLKRMLKIVRAIPRPYAYREVAKLRKQALKGG